jgi:hypothetical protein
VANPLVYAKVSGLYPPHAEWSAISSVLGELPPADRDAVLGGTARVSTS